MKKLYAVLNRLRLPRSLLSSLVVQGASVIAPFALIPFYARTLDVVGLGNLAIAQAASLILGSAVDYGFHISGTRAVATNRTDAGEVSSILASVHSAKVVMALLVLVGCLIAAFCVPGLRDHRALFAWSAIYGVLQGFTLTWFFGGLQRQIVGVSLDLAAKLTAIPLILLSVSGPNDAWLIQAWFAACQAFWILVGLQYARKAYRFLPLSWSRATGMLIKSRHIFFQHVVGMSYNASTSLLLGAMTTSQTVGFFSGAERLARMPLMPVAPYRQIFFPIIAERVSSSAHEAATLWRWLALFAMTVMAICGLIFFLFAHIIVYTVLGPRFSTSVAILKILAFLPLLVGAGELVGTYWLLPHKRDKAVSNCLAISTVAHVALMAGLCPFLGAMGAALSIILSQGLFLVLTALACLQMHRESALVRK